MVAEVNERRFSLGIVRARTFETRARPNATVRALGAHACCVCGTCVPHVCDVCAGAADVHRVHIDDHVQVELAAHLCC